MNTEVKHYLNPDFPNGIEKTEKVTRFFGIVVKRKTYHYPKLKNYEVVGI